MEYQPNNVVKNGENGQNNVSVGSIGITLSVVIEYNTEYRLSSRIDK